MLVKVWQDILLKSNYDIESLLQRFGNILNPLWNSIRDVFIVHSFHIYDLYDENKRQLIKTRRS